MSLSTASTPSSTPIENDDDQAVQIMRLKAQKIQSKLEQLYPTVPDGFLDHSDPFTLLIAVLLSAQATDVKVNQVTAVLFAEANTPEDMVALGLDRIQQIIKPLGLYVNKGKNILALSKDLVENHDSKVPDSLEALEKLAGVGHKTASVVMIQAFKKPAFPVDTHINRLACRWGCGVFGNADKTEAILKKWFSDSSTWAELHLRLILFGREYCPATRHNMEECPICSFAATEEAWKSNQASPTKFIAPKDNKNPYIIRPIPEGVAASEPMDGGDEKDKQAAAALRGKKRKVKHTNSSSSGKPPSGQGKKSKIDPPEDTIVVACAQASKKKSTKLAPPPQQANGTHSGRKKNVVASSVLEDEDAEMYDDQQEDFGGESGYNLTNDDDTIEVSKQKKARTGRNNVISYTSDPASTGSLGKAIRTSTRMNSQLSGANHVSAGETTAEDRGPSASRNRHGRKRKVREEDEVETEEEVEDSGRDDYVNMEMENGMNRSAGEEFEHTLENMIGDPVQVSEKRGRGRPKRLVLKMTTSEAHSEAANDDDSDLEIEPNWLDDGGQLQPDAESKPRGRGRPKKVKLDDGSGSNGTSEALGVQNETGLEKPRGRGRPRKIKVDDEPGNSNGPSNANGLQGDGELETPRRRGRPKKMKLDNGTAVPSVAQNEGGVEKRRGRGRPRKIKPDDDGSVDAQAAQSEGESKKRGRGRPRKIKPDDGSDNDSTADVLGAQSVGELATPRGRGRPRKIQVNGVGNDGTVNTPSAQGEAERRGRGRPRKTKVDDGIASSQSEVQTEKRGRGRPRKFKLDEGTAGAQSEGEPERRGRGRPRKIKADEGTAAQSEGGSEKRGRGRPRKIKIGDGTASAQSEGESEKRGRGRPRKIKLNDDGTPGRSGPQSEGESEKRGRGRPRKLKVDGTEINGSPGATGLQGDGESVTPRGRGRPKKIKLDDDLGNGGISSVPGAHSEGMSATPRGRGRPRKTRIDGDEAVNVRMGAQGSEDVQIETKPRGRGRPKKIVTTGSDMMDENEEDGITHEAEYKSEGELELAPKARGRGRPKKNRNGEANSWGIN